MSFPSLARISLRGVRVPVGNCFDPLILPNAKFFCFYSFQNTEPLTHLSPSISFPHPVFFFLGHSRGWGGHSLTCGQASLCCFVVQHCLFEGEESWSTNGEAEVQLALTDLISSCGVDGKQPLVASLPPLTQFRSGYRCQYISWL